GSNPAILTILKITPVQKTGVFFNSLYRIEKRQDPFFYDPAKMNCSNQFSSFSESSGCSDLP
ncbi:hypothetical protein, partial [Ileibacterium valens]|uniref:hypothetical protein n=1 Tax=Ileibacterium valens TaxID=1862668 RepID=UPI00272A48DF